MSNLTIENAVNLLSGGTDFHEENKKLLDIQFKCFIVKNC